MFTVSRSIEIDAGHRVPFHASKCRHLHGHRWKVIAIAEAEETVDSATGAADSGMVVDFGVLKQVLMEEINDVFDHRFMVWQDDPLAEILIRATEEDTQPAEFLVSEGGPGEMGRCRKDLRDSIVIVPVIPTAEELARYWAGLVAPRLRELSGDQVSLKRLDVWETPNSCASYELAWEPLL